MKIVQKIKIFFKKRPALLIQVVIIIVSFILIFSYYSFFQPSMASVKENIVSQRRSLVDASRAELEASVENNIDSLSTLSDKLILTENELEKKKMVEKFMRENSLFMEISVADLSGQEKIRVSKFSVFDSQSLPNVSETQGFQGTLKDKTYLGRIEMTKKATPYFEIGISFKGAGDDESEVLLAQLSLQEIWNILSNSRLTNPRQKMFLVDSEGFLIGNPSDNSLVLKRENMLSYPGVRRVIKDKTDLNYLEYRRDAKETRIISGAVFNGGLGWGVFLDEPRKQALLAYDKIKKVSLIFIILTSSLLILLIANARELRLIFSDLNQGKENLDAEVKKRTEQLAELDKTTKLLVGRDLELLEANRKLQEMDTIKSEFVSVAAHQLRTPLTGIKWSYLALLESDPGSLTADQQKIIEDGLKAINHTIELINDLLNVAHIEEGKYGFNFSKKSITELIENTYKRYLPIAKEKGINLKLEFDSNELHELMIDSDKMSIVFDNLIDNAVKYTSPGGEVALSVRGKDGSVEFKVRDTGIGVPEDQKHRLFSKFFRADNALLFQTSGSGLGLYMVKNIIDRHCGTISFESEENKGTAVSFSLPKTAACIIDK
ncbi:MAG: sensor histidine kinase [Parcubacteria group bacterium]|jgi:signal transduction histidine kinase